MNTITTLCSGGDAVGVGAKAAGLHHLWGIELDDDIAQVARDNGFNVITADVTTIDPSQFERSDKMHVSPPCPEFSQANSSGKESADDIAIAKATVRFVETLTPRVFTLENVWGYRKSESWRLIASALNRLGYWMDVQHLNSADFGVPQTRKRMIVRAILGGWLPPLPQPESWQGWYSAIENLLPDLPDSKFAPWQLERGVQDLLDQTCLLAQGSFDHTNEGNEREAQTIGKRFANEPEYTVVSNSNMIGMRAFLVSGANASGITIRDSAQPANTVVASVGEKGTYPRAAISGRVVRMTARCLARFQSFPDSYIFPEKATLATRVIGNAVPPLMYQKIVEQFNCL